MNTETKHLPMLFPDLFSEGLFEGLSNLERLFKQPIKDAFPYPLDVKKVYDKKTGKPIKLVFEVALAGVSKNDLKVQLKKGKYLTIKIEQPKEIEKPTEEKEEESTEATEYILKTLSHRDGEITWKILFDVDTTKFKPTFVNGLLTVELFAKEVDDEEDIVTAKIQ